MPLVLAALFFLTALIYAAVGFGGGSTYTALLVLYGADYRVLPAIALGCNILVVSGGAVHFIRAGHVSLRRLWPFLITSIPAAWLGGRISVSETLFVGLLGGALLVSGIYLGLQKAEPVSDQLAHDPPLPIAATAGIAIGALSGLVGVGGGIFLAPLLYFWKWGNPRRIAAACCIFILCNSLSGLTGQIMKLQETRLLAQAAPYWPLLPAVLIGGQFGSLLATRGLKSAWVMRLTAVLILYVAVRLIWRWAGMTGLAGTAPGA
jgi:uncharacterized protein